MELALLSSWVWVILITALNNWMPDMFTYYNIQLYLGILIKRTAFILPVASIFKATWTSAVRDDSFGCLCKEIHERLFQEVETLISIVSRRRRTAHSDKRQRARTFPNFLAFKLCHYLKLNLYCNNRKWCRKLQWIFKIITSSRWRFRT